MNERKLRTRADQKIHPSRNAVAIHQVHHLRVERTSRNVGILKILESVNRRNLAPPAELIIVADLRRDLIAVHKVRRIIREMYNLVPTGCRDRRTRRKLLDHICNRQIVDAWRLTQTAEVAQSKQSAQPLSQSSADISDSAQPKVVSARLSVSSEPERSFRQIAESIPQREHAAAPQNFLFHVELLNLGDAGINPAVKRNSANVVKSRLRAAANLLQHQATQGPRHSSNGRVS